MSEVFKEIVKTPNGMVLPRIVAELTPSQLADISNGCGPASEKVKLVPDRIAGVDFYAACCGHDGCYSFGIDEEDKREADRCFLYNLLHAVDEHCAANGIVLRAERVAARRAAFDYYDAVADFGDSAFYAGKTATTKAV